MSVVTLKPFIFIHEASLDAATCQLSEKELQNITHSAGKIKAMLHDRLQSMEILSKSWEQKHESAQIVSRITSIPVRTEDRPLLQMIAGSEKYPLVVAGQRTFEYLSDKLLKQQKEVCPSRPYLFTPIGGTPSSPNWGLYPLTRVAFETFKKNPLHGIANAIDFLLWDSSFVSKLPTEAKSLAEIFAVTDLSQCDLEIADLKFVNLFLSAHPDLLVGDITDNNVVKCVELALEEHNEELLTDTLTYINHRAQADDFTLTGYSDKDLYNSQTKKILKIALKLSYGGALFTKANPHFYIQLPKKSRRLEAKVVTLSESLSHYKITYTFSN